MRAPAQSPTASPPSASPRSSLLATAAFGRSLEAGPDLLRQRAAGKEAVKQPPVEPGGSAEALFAQDFSRVPIQSQEVTDAPEGAERSGGESASQDGCPPGIAWVPGKRIPPTFVPNKTVAERSNRYSSITIPDKVPEVTGHVAVDCKERVWRYQLDPFVSKVDITIYYYDENHYPAPTPTDDTGELTNVTKGNCKAMIEELHRDKSDVHRNWSAYRRDHLHEDYHYKVEWQGAMKKFVPAFEAAVEKVGLPFTKAKTEEDADKILAPAVRSAHGTGYSKEWHAWDDLPDVPHKGAYLAQVPAIEFLIDRVLKHAVGKKWLPAGYTPGKSSTQADLAEKAEKQEQGQKDSQQGK